MDTPEKRRAIKDSMEQTRLELAHTAGCVVLPDRLHLLDRMPKCARVAELGVAFGDFSREILQRTEPRRLFLIDSWASERYQAGLQDIRERFAEEIESGRVIVKRALSADALREFAPGTLDWVYIDTNHTYETTLEELALCDSILGNEGRIAGHDFCTGNVIDAIPYGVVEAVTKFCKDASWRFEYLTVESRGHFSFCLKRLKATRRQAQ